VTTAELEAALTVLDARADELRAEVKRDEGEIVAKTAELGELYADGDTRQAAAVEKAIDQLRQLVSRANQGLLSLGRRRDGLVNDLAASRLADAHAEIAALEAEAVTAFPALAGAVDDMIEAWNGLHQVAKRSNALAHAYPRDIAPRWSSYGNRPPDWWGAMLTWRKDLQRRIDAAQEPPAA
jgi:D-serine deaminase-like pyridoxal phosphate-dependent protein